MNPEGRERDFGQIKGKEWCVSKLVRRNVCDGQVVKDQVETICK